MAMAGKLYVDGGEPNQGWKIIRSVHQGEGHVGLPATGKRAKKPAGARSHVQAPVNQHLNTEQNPEIFFNNDRNGWDV
jgi:hypothetical protein